MRPEQGVSAALPARLCVLHSERFTIALPAGHRFPMQKYAQLRNRLEATLGDALAFEEAPACPREVLHLAHDPGYVRRVLEGGLAAAELRRLGLPWSPALAERSLRAVGATLRAVEQARADGVAVSLAGGTHHAARDGGAGFCVFNDAAIAALVERRRDKLARVAIVDCDVHQGDGTARILDGVDGIYTLSVHSARNYPHAKASSDCDIGLPDGCEGPAYLEALGRGLDYLFALAAPQMVIYNAGADPFAGDSLGRLALDKAALAERDRVVIRRAQGQGAAVAVVMGGGYPPDLDDAVDIHAATVGVALAARQRQAPRDATGVASDRSGEQAGEGAR